MILFLDFETCSRVDLKRTGAIRYASDPSTIATVVSYATAEALTPEAVRAAADRVTVVQQPAGLWADSIECAELVQLIEECDAVVAWNAPFDAAIWNRAVPKAQTAPAIPTHKRLDAAVLSRACGGAGDLKTASSTFPYGDLLSSKAKRPVMFNKFTSVPSLWEGTTGAYVTDMAARHADSWAQFVAYARQDTAAMARTVARILEALFSIGSGAGTSTYEHIIDRMLDDARINERGHPVDVEALTVAAARAHKLTAQATQRCKELTGGIAPTQVAALTMWVRARSPIPVSGLTKNDVTKLLARKDLPAQVREVLMLRQQVGKSSVSKLTAMLAANVNGRIHGALATNAAQTGRAGGRLWQPQNQPRPTRDDAEIEALFQSGFDGADMRALSDCIRGMVASDKGVFAADYSNIEGRGLAWLAGQTDKVRQFADFDAGIGEDIYILAAMRAFGVEDKADLPKNGRQVGKVIELALGYNGGLNAFDTMASIYSVELPERTKQLLIKRWRAAHPKVTALWAALDRAARLTATTKRGTRVSDKLYWDWSKEGHVAWLVLPSGRALPYPGLNLQRQGPRFGGAALSYWSPRYNSWQYTYGGKLTENAVQALASDILYDALHRANEAGIQVVLHVHDEIVGEGPVEDYQALLALMRQPPAWCEDMPLAVEGWHGNRYRK